MAYEIFIEKKAEKDLRKLPKNYQNKIIQKISNLKDTPKPPGARKNNFFTELLSNWSW
jgi:mRNA-degrading endonuclease RelE of RelBE toxin-antitoxin system